MIVGVPDPGLPGYAGSLVHLLQGIARAAAGTVHEVRLSPGFEDGPGQERAWREYLSECDVAFSIASEMGWRRQTRTRCPLIHLPLGELPRGAPGCRQHMMLLEPTDIVAPSCRADIAILENLFPVCAPRVELLPFFVDEQLFAPVPVGRRDALREALDLSRSDCLFVYAGRVTAEKNVHGLIDALAPVLLRHPEAHLLVIGPVQNVAFSEFGVATVDLEGFLRRQIDCYPELSARITLRPEVARERLAELLAAADVFVNLTLHHDENFCFANAEAMSAGLPVLTTDWGALKDHVDHGESGFVVPAYLTSWGVRFDSIAAGHYAQMLVSDGDLRARLGRAARERVIERFSEQRFERRVNELIAMAATTAALPRPRTETSELADALSRAFHTLRDGAPVATLPRYDAANYRLYEEIIRPYTTGPAPSELTSTTALRLTPTAFELTEGQLVSHDPLWPTVYPVTAKDAELVAVVEDLQSDPCTATIPAQKVCDRLGWSLDELCPVARRLAQSGVIVLSDLGASPLDEDAREDFLRATRRRIARQLLRTARRADAR